MAMTEYYRLSLNIILFEEKLKRIRKALQSYFERAISVAHTQTKKPIE